VWGADGEGELGDLSDRDKVLPHLQRRSVPRRHIAHKPRRRYRDYLAGGWIP